MITSVCGIGPLHVQRRYVLCPASHQECNDDVLTPLTLSSESLRWPALDQGGEEVRQGLSRADARYLQILPSQDSSFRGRDLGSWLLWDASFFCL